MFKKATTVEDPLDIRHQMQTKALNHEFFLLVREQKYEEAYAIGTMYLKYYPENQSIRRFCQFIQGNREELIKMVHDEQEYTDGESDDDEQEEQEQEDEDEDEKSVFSEVSVTSSVKSVKTEQSSKSVKSSVSNKEKVSTKSLKGKQNDKVCPYHKWEHTCKNANCPNQKKK